MWFSALLCAAHVCETVAGTGAAGPRVDAGARRKDEKGESRGRAERSHDVGGSVRRDARGE